VEKRRQKGGVFSHYLGNFLDFLYNIAQRNIKKEIFRVDIELYQHGSWPISVQNLQMLYYKYLYNYNIAYTPCSYIMI
jgi:hypothetical protein